MKEINAEDDSNTPALTGVALLSDQELGRKLMREGKPVEAYPHLNAVFRSIRKASTNPRDPELLDALREVVTCAKAVRGVTVAAASTPAKKEEWPPLPAGTGSPVKGPASSGVGGGGSSAKGAPVGGGGGGAPKGSTTSSTSSGAGATKGSTTSSAKKAKK